MGGDSATSVTGGDRGQIFVSELAGPIVAEANKALGSRQEDDGENEMDRLARARDAKRSPEERAGGRDEGGVTQRPSLLGVTGEMMPQRPDVAPRGEGCQEDNPVAVGRDERSKVRW